MKTAKLINKIKEILNGIDADEIDDNEGWWETSAGVAFGTEKLKEVIQAIKDFANQSAVLSKAKINDLIYRLRYLIIHSKTTKEQYDHVRDTIAAICFLVPGFEHLPDDAQESGIATDHTMVAMNEERKTLEAVWQLRDLITYGGKVAKEYPDEAKALDDLMKYVEKTLQSFDVQEEKIDKYDAFIDFLNKEGYTITMANPNHVPGEGYSPAPFYRNVNTDYAITEFQKQF